MALLQVGDDGGLWTKINPLKGYSKLILQFRGEEDGFTANSMIVRGPEEFSSVVTFSLQGIILEEGDSIVLPASGPWEVRPVGDVTTALRYVFAP
jgi:hypothetical protein